MILLLAAGCGRRGHSEWDAVVDSMARLEKETKEAPEKKTASAGKGRLWSQPVGAYREVFNDSNYLQYQSAERLGIDPMHTLGDAYNTRRPLVKIESGRNYTVDKLTHSMPFLVPEAAALLDEIGRDFKRTLAQRGGDTLNKIIVTSMLRSPYSVKRLRRVNRNAVDSSTHMFATTFDISWSHFDCPDSTRAEDAVALKGILAEILLQKRNEGKCYVKFERKTPCFHITVAR